MAHREEGAVSDSSDISEGMSVLLDGHRYEVAKLHGSMAYVRRWNPNLCIYEKVGEWKPVEGMQPNGWAKAYQRAAKARME
jgi:hypothetical protein